MERLKEWKRRLLAAQRGTPFAEKKLVFGEGQASPALMMIGEAPGGDEEEQGRPFVGKAGKTLSAFLEKAGLERGEIYISNVVKLRPTKESPKTGKPVNRPPSGEEIAFFLPFLREEIEIVSPKLIVTLGNVPLKAVTGDKAAVIGDYHGKPFPLPDGRMLFALYHPAAIIYNRALRAAYDEDLLRLRQFLAQEGGVRMKKTDLQQIPYVGKRTEESLLLLGFDSIASLKGADPEEMYRRECLLAGQKIDRCQLYVYRMAVYYAENETHDPAKLKWWAWKD